MTTTPDNLAAHMKLVQSYANAIAYGAPERFEPAWEAVKDSARALITRADALERQAVPPEYLIRARWPDGIEQYLDVRGVYQLSDSKVGIDVNAPEGHPLASSPSAPTERQAVPSLTEKQRLYLAQASEMLEDAANDQRAAGNDSFASGTEASAHEIKQMLASSPPAPAQPECRFCGGTGQVEQYTSAAAPRVKTKCPMCAGDGVCRTPKGCDQHGCHGGCLPAPSATAQSEVAEPQPACDPIALLWQVRHALALACAICDAVPNREPGHLGKLVNAQEDGTHGYREIHDAEAALSSYLTTPTATPPQPSPVADEREAFEAWVLSVGLPNHGEADWAWRAWQARAALASQPTAQGEPLSDDWIRSMCKNAWVFETVKHWVRVVEAAHHIGRKA